MKRRVSIFTRVARWVGGTRERVDRGARECAEDVVSFLAPFGPPVSGVAVSAIPPAWGCGDFFDPPAETLEEWGSGVWYLLRYCSSF